MVEIKRRYYTVCGDYQFKSEHALKSHESTCLACIVQNRTDIRNGAFKGSAEGSS